MLKKTAGRYQHVSVRKVKRAQGFAWEFRYYVMEGSVRKPKVQTLHGQMGAEDAELRRFRAKVLLALKKIQLVYPALKLETTIPPVHAESGDAKN